MRLFNDAMRVFGYVYGCEKRITGVGSCGEGIGNGCDPGWWGFAGWWRRRLLVRMFPRLS